MLMALLPLAGWAEDPTVVTIKIGSGTAAASLSQDYNGSAVTIAEVKAGETDITSNTEYTQTWYKGETVVTELKDAGVYTLKVTKEGSTFADATLTINKLTLTVTAKNPSMTYGGTAPTITDFYDATGWHTGESAATVGDPVALPTGFDITNAGTRQFTLQAVELTNYNVSVTSPTGTLSIAKKAITVSPNAVEAIAYGAATPTFSLADYSAGLVGEDVLDGTATYIVKKAGTVVENAATTTLAAGNDYTVEAAGLSNDNYNITFASVNFTVTQKALAASMITDIAAVTYDGESHKPTVTVTDNDLIAATDYTVAFSKGGSTIAEADYATSFINAGTYKVTLTAASDGNYSGTVEKEFVINKKAVQLRTLGDELTYSHQKFYTGTDDYKLTNAAHLQWTGVLDADMDATNNTLSSTALNGASIALKLYNGTTSSATEVTSSESTILTAGTYNVRAVITNADNITNYAVTVGNIGKIVVSKKTVKITPKSVSYNYGSADASKFLTATDAADGDLWVGTTVKDADGNITGVTDGTGLATDDVFTTVFSTNKIKLTREAGTAAGTYALTASLPTAAFDNYTFEIVEAGTFKINPIGGVQVWANNASSDYKGTQANLTAEIVGVEAEDITEEIQNAVNAAVSVSWPEGKDATTAPAGDYTITFDETALTAALAGLTNYDKTTVGKYTGTYTINRAALTVKAAAQVHQVGEAVTATASASTIEFEGTAPTGADLTAIYSALTLEYSSSLSSYVDSDKKLKTEALQHGKDAESTDTQDGVYVDGIMITADKITAYNAAAGNNYTLTAKAGQLTVTTNEVQQLDGTKTDNTTTLAAIEGNKLNVQIKDRTLYGGEWNALTLPFDVEPLVFCQTIGSYAVFDRLEESGSEMNFKITTATIPAYTPFLVKVNEDVALSDKTFNAITIAAADASAMAPSNDAYIFQGTLDQSTPVPAWIITANSQGTGNIDLYHNVEGGTNYACRGFAAYIKAKEASNSAAPVINIEEIDGSVTTISAISAEGVAVKAEGWYTLNGVKLNAAPTQKGVYINNGKKIVIK